MSKKDEALKLALEALEEVNKLSIGKNAICLPAEIDTAMDAIREALAEQPAQQQEPVAWKYNGNLHEFDPSDWATGPVTPLYTSPPASNPLTPREIELLDGMIEVQLHHAAQCDRITNRTMAEKQKGWDMERVALLRKLKEKNT